MLYRSPVIPSIESNDLAGTIAFYCNVLGFEVVGTYPDPDDGEPVWAMLERDAANLMVSVRNAHSREAETLFTGSLCFYPEDVDQFWASVSVKIDPSRIEWPLETFDYGMREFGIKDPNGYLLRFGQAQEIKPE